MKPVLIIQNDAKEGPGQLGALLAQHGIRIDMQLGWAAEYDHLDPVDYAGLVMLGGAQGAYETDTYPYLVGEIDLIRKFIDADKPVMGLCLGGQLIATALGGNVYPGSRKEIGWYDIRFSAEAKDDLLLEGQPAFMSAFHFHGDCFDLPTGCVGLASSALTPCQLFRLGDKVYGFQFHPEVDVDLLTRMCRNNTDYMRANGFDAQAVIDESAVRLTEYMQRTRRIFEHWIGLLPDDQGGVA